jgi:hypothetical protein
LWYILKVRSLGSEPACVWLKRKLRMESTVSTKRSIFEISESLLEVADVEGQRDEIILWMVCPKFNKSFFISGRLSSFDVDWNLVLLMGEVREKLL